MMRSILIENYPTHTNHELAYVLGLHITSVRMKLYELGYKRMEMEYFTEEQALFLIENYTGIGDVEMAEIFERTWPKKKKWTCKHIRKKRVYLNLHRTAEQIEVVRTRNVSTGRFAECAVKMWRVRNAAAEGEVRIWTYKDGNHFKVIKTESGFVHYAHWLYEKSFGEIPSGFVISFKDRNNLNVVLENLEIISRGEHARRNTSGRLPDDLKKTMKALNLLLSTINTKKDEI